METVLVTGGAGFIGSNLVGVLLQSGYRVICVDNFDDTYDARFKEEHIASSLSDSNFELVRLDICDRPALFELFNRVRPTLVAHLAAKVDTRAAVENPHPYVKNNITGLLNVLDAAKELGVKNLVF